MYKVDDTQIEEMVRLALQEDLQTGDITGLLIDEHQFSSAEIITREPMVLSGQDWLTTSVKLCDPNAEIEWYVKDGDKIDAELTLCKIKANSRALLSAERTGLNFIQLLSGIATTTHQFVEQLSEPTRLLDTRKTLPLLRHAQKYAVACGGGVNHRFGLYDAFLIKENHIKACGSILDALSKARALYPEKLLEIEVETLDELKLALQGSVDRIMLDNFTIEMIQKAMTIRGEQPVAFEVSGNINLDNIAAVSATGVDYISVGALTKSVKAIDLSLLIREVWCDE